MLTRERPFQGRRSADGCAAFVRSSDSAQEELAGKRAGLHWTYISGIERGRRNPGLNTIGRLAAALRVSVAELVAASTMAVGHRSRRHNPRLRHDSSTLGDPLVCRVPGIDLRFVANSLVEVTIPSGPRLNDRAQVPSRLLHVYFIVDSPKNGGTSWTRGRSSSDGAGWRSSTLPSPISTGAGR